MNKLTMSAGVIALLILTMAVVAFAQGRGGNVGSQAASGGMTACTDRMTTCVAALELTAEQTAHVVALQQETAAKLAAFQQDFVAKRAELRTLRQQGAASAQLDAKVQEIMTLRQSIWQTRSECRSRFTSILTPEQHEKLPCDTKSGAGGGRGGCGMGNGGGCRGNHACPVPAASPSPDAS